MRVGIVGSGLVGATAGYALVVQGTWLGTTLDTARFRSLFGARCGVDPHHVHAYVIGNSRCAVSTHRRRENWT